MDSLYFYDILYWYDIIKGKYVETLSILDSYI